MDVRDAIEKRRAYRSLAPVPITDGMLSEVIESVRSTPSFTFRDRYSGSGVT